MNEITFTFEEQKFTLDLVQGVLHGPEGKAKDRIDRALSDAIKYGYAGDNICNWSPVDVTDPYRDIHQFAACMMEASLYRLYPPELNPYRPELYEEKELRELEEEIQNAIKDLPESEHARVRKEIEDKYKRWKEWEAECVRY